MPVETMEAKGWNIVVSVPEVAPDVIVYRSGEYAIAVNKWGDPIAVSKDHAQVIQKAIDSTPDYGLLFISGSFNLTTGVQVKKPITVHINGYIKAVEDMDYMIRFGDTDKEYHNMRLILDGVLDGNNLAKNGLLLTRTVDSLFQGIVIQNCYGTGIYLEELNSHVVIRDFTVGYCGQGVAMDNVVEFIQLENINTYVNENQGYVIRGGPIVLINCLSNGDASKDLGTGNWVNNGFLLLDVKKQVLMIGCKVWTNSGAHLNRAFVINFPGTLDEPITVRMIGCEFRPDGGVPASLEQIIRVITSYDNHKVFIDGLDVESGGGKPIVDMPNDVGYVYIKNSRLIDVDSPTGYVSRVILKYNTGYITESSGVAVFSGDGSTTQFKVEHGLIKAPSKVIVTPLSADAKDFAYAEADDTYIYFNFSTAPPSGTDNVKLSWHAEV